MATAPPAPKPLRFDEVIETLTALHDLPELLERIEQADRAALYQALGLTVRYRRVGSTEEVKLTSTLRSVDLERVGEKTNSEDSQVPGLQGVDLERVGGGTPTRFGGFQPSPLDCVQGRTSCSCSAHSVDRRSPSLGTLRQVSVTRQRAATLEPVSGFDSTCGDYPSIYVRRVADEHHPIRITSTRVAASTWIGTLITRQTKRIVQEFRPTIPETPAFRLLPAGSAETARSATMQGKATPPSLT